MSAMIACTAKISAQIPSRCVNQYAAMKANLLQNARLNFNADNYDEGTNFLQMYLLAPLVCLSYHGPQTERKDGTRKSKREVIRLRINLINEKRWEQLSLASLGLVNLNKSNPSKSLNRRRNATSLLSPLEHTVTYLCSKGNFSRAFSVLFPKEPAPSTTATFDKLSALHPQVDTTSQFSQEFMAFVSNSNIEITEESVCDYIHKSDYLTC